jgi:hypothetical protein
MLGSTAVSTHAPSTVGEGKANGDEAISPRSPFRVMSSEAC